MKKREKMKTKKTENFPGKFDPAVLSVGEIREILSRCSSLGGRELELLQRDPRKGVQDLLKRWLKHVRVETAEQERLHKMSLREKELQEKGYAFVAGVDEAGRGPLAGPVVAAAVILDWRKVSLWRELDDSKKLSITVRERLFTMLAAEAEAIAVGVVDHALIDRMNIHRASLEAMRLAVRQLHPQPDYLLCDGFTIPGVEIPQEGIKGGDGSCLCIAAASIVAKVIRDRAMNGFAALYPGYGFERHKGYGTSLHYALLELLGPSPLHRRSFSRGWFKQPVSPEQECPDG